jgi:PAS domain S-box-containing protein
MSPRNRNGRTNAHLLAEALGADLVGAYCSLLDGIQEALFVLNRQSDFLYMNDTARRAVGLKPDQWVGKTMWDIFPEPIAERQAATIERIFESGETKIDIAPTELKGHVYHYRTFLRPLQGADGRIAAVLGFSQDVSDFVDANRALEIERDYIRELLDTANSLIISLDRNARVVEFNAACEQVTGYTRNEAIGKHWPTLVLPRDHSAHRIRDFGEWVRLHPRDAYEGPIITKSGQERTILWSTSAIFGHDGDDVIAIAVGQDITERKQAENLLRASEEKYRGLFEQAGESILLIDPDTGRFIEFNDRAHENLGYTREEFSTLRLMDIDAAENVEQTIDHMHELIRHDSDVFQTQHRTKTGEIRDVHVSGRSIRLHGRELILSVCRDITVLKQAEKALQESRDDLERRVNDRTRELLELNRKLETEIEERTRIEEALRQSEAEIRTIAENIPGVVYSYDKLPDGRRRLLYVGPGLEDLVGSAKAAELGDSADDFYQLIHPDDRAGLERASGDAASRDEPISYEYRVIAEDGGFRWVRTNARPTNIGNGTTRWQGVLVDITDQKKTEQALRESEERFRMLSEAAEEAIFIHNQGVIVDANQAASRMSGYTLDELIGTSGSVLTTAQTWEVVKNRIVTGREDSTELTIIRKSGEHRICEVVAKRFTYQDQKLRVVAMRDITDRKKTEKRLRESERRFRELADLLPQAIFESDEQGRLTFLNRTGFDVMGCSPEDLENGLMLTDLIAEKDVPRVRENFTKRMRAEISGGIEYLAQRRDGSTLPILSYASPIIRDGKPVGLRGFVVDISSRKKVEEALMESERRFRELAELLPQVVIEADVEGRLTFINGMGEKVLGYNMADVESGLYTMQLVSDADRGRAATNLSRRLAGAELGGIEYTGQRKDGSLLPLLIYADPIRRGDEVVGIRGTMVDITDRKKAENLLHATTDRLRKEQKSLSDKNIALQQVLSHIESERQDYKHRIAREVQETVNAFLGELRAGQIVEHPKILEELEMKLNSMLEKNIDAYQDLYAQLTPRELQICDLIREGLSSKQISDRVNLSLYTVHKHREQIRKKLGITNKDVNLGTFLRTSRPNRPYTE